MWSRLLYIRVVLFWFTFCVLATGCIQKSMNAKSVDSSSSGSINLTLSGGTTASLQSGSTLVVALVFSDAAPSSSTLSWQIVGSGSDFSTMSGTVAVSAGDTASSISIVSNVTGTLAATRNYALTISGASQVFSGSVAVAINVVDGMAGTVVTGMASRNVFDSQGNFYIGDTNNHAIRKIDASTGFVTTIAGGNGMGYTGDGGAATSATLKYPGKLTIDSSDNIYFSDISNYAIRKINTTTGIITTVVGTGVRDYSGDGGLATNAKIGQPQGLVLDSDGNLYFADTDVHVVRRVDASTGIITTVAGNGIEGYTGNSGPAWAAQMSYPMDVALDGSGNLYIADSGNYVIRKVNASTGVISTVVGNASWGYSGDGSAANYAQLQYPTSIAFNSSGDLIISDDTVVRKVSGSTNIITTIAGTGTNSYTGDGGLATAATMKSISGVALDSSDNCYIADSNAHVVRMVTDSTGIISTILGTGVSGYSGDGGLATAAKINGPY